MSEMNVLANQIVKEGNEMNQVKKATELTSLDQLNLDSRMRYNIRQKKLPFEELVLIGRIYYEGKRTSPNYTQRGDKWKTALMWALDEAGFIRHDLGPITFATMRLYAVVFHDYPEFVGTLVRHFSELTNEHYENLVVPTEEQHRQFDEALSARLTPREERVILRRFGFHDGEPWTLLQCAKEVYVTRERMRQIEAKALRKLRSCDQLPKIFPNQPEIIPATIDGIQFSPRVLRCLKWIQIDSVEGILNYPPEEWANVRHLGFIGCVEIQDKIRAAGHPEFTIPGIED